MGTLFVECSAKTNVGVVDIFQDLVRQVSLHSDPLHAGHMGDMLIRDRFYRDPSYGPRARRRTRRSRSPRMRMTVKDGVDVDPDAWLVVGDLG